MDQRRSAIVKHIIKCFSCLPMSLTYVLSYISLINHLINDRLLDALTNRHSICCLYNIYYVFLLLNSL